MTNGKVLIAGGYSWDSDLLSSAELWDPATQTFTPTGSMAVPRVNHTATLLPAGLVLVTGGFTRNNADMVTAELYHPDTGTWSLAAPMQVRRSYQTATLLSNGTVLVAGGEVYPLSQPPSPPASDAEIYDPVSDHWTLTGPMRVPDRRGSGAALLPNGTVVLVGGGRSIDSLAETAERYDPATSAWTSVAAPRMGYVSPAVLLRTGNVLLVGGTHESYAPTRPGDVDAEVYDPATNRWAPTSAMPSRCVGTVTLLTDGSVLVVCGALAERYNPANDRWTLAASPATYRGYHTATLLPNGSVLVVGGAGECGNCPVKDSAELYTP